jgi:hypothetical protein
MDGDIASHLIPAISVPLELSRCQCDGLEDLGNSLTLGPIFTATRCDIANCSDSRCSIGVGPELVSHTAIDPCSESITVTVNNYTTGELVLQEVFYNNRSMLFPYPGFTPILYVMINHYMYSMVVSVSSLI